MRDLAAILLSPLGAAYRAGMAVRGALYGRGLLASADAGVPVVCVGNLTLGGTGKTPMVALVASALRDAGRRPAIVSRGYRRATPPGELVVVSDGGPLLADPAAAGDEPVLLASMLPGVAVAVCADRARAARELVGRGLCDCVVLDDGFQHLALRRDADLVLVDATRDLARLRMFPAGTLREPPHALARAAAVVHTRAGGSPDHSAANRALVAARFPAMPQFTARFIADRVTEGPDGGTDVPPDALPGHLLAFAGIAHPDPFFAAARALAPRVDTLPLPDHAAYDAATIDRVIRAARDAGTADLLTTAKDAVKLRGVMPPDGMRLLVLHQRVEVEPLDGFRAVLARAVAR